MATQEHLAAFAKMYIKSINGEYKGFETAGLFSINLDEREDFKAQHIKPALPGFHKYTNTYDTGGLVTQKDEEEIILPFEDLAEQAMRQLETEFAGVLADLVREKFNIV